VLLAACKLEKRFEIHDAWMRPAKQGENGAVYFEFHNHGSVADEITGASSDAAEVVELQESTLIGDVMEMKPVELIPLEPFEEIEFMPGGFHVLLIGLKQDLEEGDKIELTVHFLNHSDVNVTVHVQENPVHEDEH
jgi:periplasmic copper chaperone A